MGTQDIEIKIVPDHQTGDRAPNLLRLASMDLAWKNPRVKSIEQQLGNLDMAKQMYLQCLEFVRELGGRGIIIQ